jgi:short-subunit dehydrogenase
MNSIISNKILIINLVAVRGTGMTRKKALVTGASSGLGEIFARCLAQQGYDLYITARRLDRLKSLQQEISSKYNVSVTVTQADLTIRDQRLRIWEEIGQHEHQIDLFINNAGFGRLEPFLEHSRTDILNVISLNTEAVTDMMHLVAPGMIKRQQGKIIIVSSLSAFPCVPYFAVYGATKGFDLLLAESLHYEWKSQGVHVMALCPGPTETEFGQSAGLKEGSVTHKSMTAEAVVQKSLTDLRRGKVISIPGWANKFLYISQKILPRWVVGKISRKMLSKIVERNRSA